CFYFNLHRWVLRPRLPDRVREFFEILLRRQVIVLYQNRVEQTEAMIGAAAGDYSRSFQRAQTGRCLSGIHDFGGIFSNRLHVLMGLRRDARKSLQNVQCEPFWRKNASGQFLDFDKWLGSM